MDITNVGMLWLTGVVDVPSSHSGGIAVLPSALCESGTADRPFLGDEG